MFKFMKIAIREATKAFKKGNVPVGSIITYKNKIIAKAHNDKFWHAEIICIQKAQKKLGTRHLKDSTIYTTLKPCPMCDHAIKIAKIHTVIYGCSNIKECNFDLSYIGNVMQKESIELLNEYFKNKRKEIKQNV